VASRTFGGGTLPLPIRVIQTIPSLKPPSRWLKTSTGSTTWPDLMRANSSMEILEHQKDLWIRLAASLQSSQTALLASDLGELERRTEEQAGLCTQLASLNCAMPWSEDRYRQWASESDSRESAPEATPPDLQLCMQEITAARASVCRLNRVYAALLRRAMSAARIFQNLLAGTMNTYPAALQGQASTLSIRE
jgi:hypothetical protein